MENPIYFVAGRFYRAEPSAPLSCKGCDFVGDRSACRRFSHLADCSDLNSPTVAKLIPYTVPIPPSVIVFGGDLTPWRAATYSNDYAERPL